MPVVAHALTQLPPDIDRLGQAAEAEGHSLVVRLVEEWHDGTNRFDRPGEVLAEVRWDGRLCAVGGLNVDPYLVDSSVGRIRHVFVHPDSRRSGVGRVLVEFLLDHANGHFERVRLRSLREPGPPFYAALGFVPCQEPDATHEVALGGHTAAR